MRVPIPRAGLLEQLLTRALSPACNTGLPTLLHSRRPCPGRSHRRPIHPAPPGAEGPTGPAAPWSFIPVTNAIDSLNARYRRAVRAEVSLPRDPLARPDREGPRQVINALEAGIQRIRHRAFEGRIVPAL